MRCWKGCPEIEGIKTTASSQRSRMAQVGRAALKSKGLRPMSRARSAWLAVGRAALKSKGLRLVSFVECDVPAVGRAALKSKGLRRNRPSRRLAECWKGCPEIEGIKTERDEFVLRKGGWKGCPEIEGIKTPSRRLAECRLVGRAALKSKGLRRSNPSPLSFPSLEGLP